MKPKIGVYLTDDVAKRLKAGGKAIRRDQVRHRQRSPLAVSRSPARERSRRGVLRRLEGLAKRIRRIHRDVEIVAETLALHIRQFLMITPPVPKENRMLP